MHFHKLLFLTLLAPLPRASWLGCSGWHSAPGLHAELLEAENAQLRADLGAALRATAEAQTRAEAAATELAEAQAHRVMAALAHRTAEAELEAAGARQAAQAEQLVTLRAELAAAREHQPVAVSVTTGEGQTHTYIVARDTTVAELRVQIAAQQGVEPSAQVLLSEGFKDGAAVLEDDSETIGSLAAPESAELSLTMLVNLWNLTPAFDQHDRAVFNGDEHTLSADRRTVTHSNGCGGSTRATRWVSGDETLALRLRLPSGNFNVFLQVVAKGYSKWSTAPGGPLSWHYNLSAGELGARNAEPARPGVPSNSRSHFQHYGESDVQVAAFAPGSVVAILLLPKQRTMVLRSEETGEELRLPYRLPADTELAIAVGLCGYNLDESVELLSQGTAAAWESGPPMDTAGDADGGALYS